MNDENLLRPEDLTPSERREAARRAGKASAEARRQRRSMADKWNVIKGMTLKEGDVDDIEQIRALSEANGKNITVEDAIIFAVTKKAMKGDIRAFESLSKYMDNDKMTKLTIKQTELALKQAQLAIDAKEMENRKLAIQLQAYEDAVAGVNTSGVQIIDDIPNEA